MKKIKTVARKPRGHKPMIGKLVVFGVGLIGGSFALALKKRRAVAHVVGVGRSRANLLAARRLGIIDEIAADAATAVRDADFVSLHMPAKPENVKFVNSERLAKMNPRAWLVNTARGAVVDEAALYDALKYGGIAGAALDVFAKEPYVPTEGSADLRSLPNVILTPHVGSNTIESNRRMAERALQNVRYAVAGDLDRLDLVNKIH